MTLPVKRYTFDNPVDALEFTAKKIGKVIDDSIFYPPIRQWAGKIAAKAGHKEYLRQAKAIYDAVLKHWSYVKDPVGVELLASTPEAVWKLVLSQGRGKGAGDCDDVVAAVGCLLKNVGFEVFLRIIQINGSLPDHIHLLLSLPGELISIDPVVETEISGFGFWPSCVREIVIDTKGNLLWHKVNKET